MKEIKEFIQELCDCAKPSANGSVVALEDATRIVAGRNTMLLRTRQENGIINLFGEGIG